MADDRDDWRGTVAKVWATLDRIAARQEESERRQEQERKDNAQRQEAAEKRLEKTEQLVAKVCRQLGRQDSRWGKIVESLVEGDLCELLTKSFGINIVETSRRVVINAKVEIDIVAVNTDTVVVAEVKTTLRKNDINKFVRNKLSRFTELRPRYRGCKVYGVIAFVKIDNNAQDIINHALQRGLIVIKSMHGTNSIVNPQEHKPQDYHP